MFECVLFIVPSALSVFEKADKSAGLDIDAYADGDPEPVGFAGYTTEKRFREDEPDSPPPIKIRVTIEEIE